MKRTVILISAVCMLWAFCCASTAFSLPRAERRVLENGLVLIVLEEHSLPFMTLELLLRAGGSKDDPSGREGLASLTATGLTLGTKHRTDRQISEDLDFVGAHLSGRAGKDYATVSLRVLKKDLNAVLPIFMDVIMEPSFPEEEVKKETARTLAGIQALEDQPGDVADKAFERAVYGESPYGHPTEGTAESVKRLTRNDLEKFIGPIIHLTRLFW
jgi:zinc protease